MSLRVGRSVVRIPTEMTCGSFLKISLSVFVGVLFVIYLVATAADMSQSHRSHKSHRSRLDQFDAGDVDDSPSIHQMRYEHLLERKAAAAAIVNQVHGVNHIQQKQRDNREANNLEDNRVLLKGPEVKPLLEDDMFKVKETFVMDQKGIPMAMDAIRDQVSDIRRVKEAVLESQTGRPADTVYDINVTLSDLISLDRDIPDTRFPVCQEKQYDLKVFPKTTVVIPFYNEAFSMLMRTVHSVLNRTPDQLLAEVILVDDLSTHQHLQEPLDSYMRLLPKVRVVRNKKREGLIRSRLVGFDLATGSVVVFLDAHTECNIRWLEPLLEELRLHPDSVLQPSVDSIHGWSIEYDGITSLYRGSFSWDLSYTWLRVPDHQAKQVREYGLPFASPTLVGCALAVGKDYFTRIGLFDDGLNVWGGENIELAWRVWMCGGSVTTVPCSRIGHVFKNSGNKFDGDKEEIVQKNLMRLADTWMDGYKKYFYASTHVYEFKRVTFTEHERSSVQKRIDLRKSLNCKTFDWYMYNLMPEVSPPPMDAVYYGEIMNKQTRACFAAHQSDKVQLTYRCFVFRMIPKNYFSLNRRGLLQFRDKCVTAEPEGTALHLAECPEYHATQKELDAFGTWRLVNRGHVWGVLRVSIMNSDGDKHEWCISPGNPGSRTHRSSPRSQAPQLTHCDKDDGQQVWLWTYKFDFIV